MPIAPSSPRQRLLPSANLAPRVPRAPSAPAASSPSDYGAKRGGLAPSPSLPTPPLPTPSSAARQARLPADAAQSLCDAPQVARARAAVAQISSPEAALVQVGLPYVVAHFTTPAVQAALRDILPTSDAQICLMQALTHALKNMMQESAEDWEDMPVEPIAIFLLSQCRWQAICEAQLFDTLQLLMRGDVAVAFLEAEARDANAARACASETFAGAPDPLALVEKILTKRRIQYWDSFLHMQSAEILREAIDAGDFARVEQLMTFAPDNSAEAVVKILFEAVGPGDAILPALRAFCAKHRLGMPQTLQPAPVPITLDYIDALMQRVIKRGNLPRDMQHFWSTLQTCDPSVRERLLRSDLDNKTAGELMVLIGASTSAQVVQAFPQHLLGQLLQTYHERFECPLLGFGFDFAARLVQNLPRDQVDALVAMNAYIVVRDLLLVGDWTLLGRIVRHTGDATRKRVIEMITVPPPPRDEHFESDTHTPDQSGTDSTDVSCAGDDADDDSDSDDIDRLSTIPGDPTAAPPPIACVE